MTTKKQAFTMRMQPKNLDKIKALAAHNNRSIANQIEYLVEQYIKDFEIKNGPISFSDKLDNDIKIANVKNIGINNESIVMQ